MIPNPGVIFQSRVLQWENKGRGIEKYKIDVAECNPTEITGRYFRMKRKMQRGSGVANADEGQEVQQ